ncbi:glycosyltransferase [Flavobacterium sp.]|uniref:glycosyltransferase n=1 Tax=Flavobacterium sp. TaxID=239 RepID=UPI003751D9CF
MKNICFVIPSLDAGGAEKALLNLLSVIDYTKYKVDLIVFIKKGIFLKQLPPQVTVISIEGNYTTFSLGLFSSIISSLKKGNLKLVFHRILFALKNRTSKNTSNAEQISWTNCSKSIPNFNKEYDVAIGALEKSSIYFVVDKLNAKSRIGWIHTNYSKSGMKKEFDINYFEKLNFLIAVSQECKDDLQLNFPKLKDAIKVIYNIVSPSLIQKLSTENITDINFNATQTTILTVARLSKEKGIDLALNASIELLKMGIQFKWYIIGDGSERNNLEQKIKENNLQETFILLGLKENPYPFVKQANIYIQPSRYEGKSIAIDEAKILQKPIIITNYPTAKDQIDNGVNGIISEMNGTAMAQNIVSLINNPTIIDNFCLNLKNENLGTESEIFKLYELFNESK